jgi:hypothetical protein
MSALKLSNARQEKTFGYIVRVVLLDGSEKRKKFLVRAKDVSKNKARTKRIAGEKTNCFGA